jgi:hypothetical protein
VQCAAAATHSSPRAYQLSPHPPHRPLRYEYNPKNEAVLPMLTMVARPLVPAADGDPELLPGLRLEEGGCKAGGAGFQDLSRQQRWTGSTGVRAPD